MPVFWSADDFANNLKGDTYGFEISADYQMLNWWRLHGGYDYLQENIYVKSGQVDLDNALDETADPRNPGFSALVHGFALAHGTGRQLAVD